MTLSVCTKSRVFPAGALAVVLAACTVEPRETPPPSSTAAPALSPMTSRGDAPGGLPPGHPQVTGVAPRSAHAVPQRMSETGSVDGTIDVAPAQRKNVKSGTVFVIARRAGSSEIIAVRRYDAERFPLPFSVSAADVMVEGAVFASPFDVTARWSKSGDAMPAPGDVEGVARHVAIGQPKVRITLSEVRR